MQEPIAIASQSGSAGGLKWCLRILRKGMLQFHNKVGPWHVSTSTNANAGLGLGKAETQQTLAPTPLFGSCLHYSS